MADDQQGRDDPREHDDISGKPGGHAKGNGADDDNPDALDDLLGTDVRDAGRVAAFDRLRSSGLTTDQAVTRMITDGILPAEEGPRFAHLHNDRPVRRKRSSGKAKGAGTGTKANGQAKGNGQAGNHPVFDTEATSRLTSWLPEIAIGLGLDPGRDLDIRPDGSWHCRTKPGYGDGSLNLIRHMCNADADTFASNWLAAHPEDGLFNVADDLGDNSAADLGRQLEVERVWQNAQPAPGTIAEDCLVGLGFDRQAIKALKPDIGALRVVDRWSGGDPALAAPITASDGSLVALHLQPLDRIAGAAKGEPHNKRGKASWLKGGMIRLGNHGEDRSTTLHMAMTLADALALRAAGMDRVAAPPRPEYLGRAAIPPDIENVVIAGTRSEETQRGLARLFAQRVPIRFAELSSGSAAGLLASSGPAALTAAMAVDAPLYQRGDDAFLDEIFRLDDVAFRLIGGKLPKGSRGKDIQVETTMGHLLAALTGDALLRSSGVQDMTKLMDRALLWLHEQEVVTLGKGLTVFRQAMTVHLNRSGGQFTVKDFAPLEEHYAEQTIQTHVMAAYAERGLAAMDQAVRLSEDYFVLEHDAFLRRWLPGKGMDIQRQTTGASWKAIVEGLDNPVQQKIVADDREQTNVLVLAGPGSGKTRVLVHRIAYLIRVRREDPRGILALTYNRHAAAEIRIRLRHLIGDEANAVNISTCHALAMRLVGASFAGAANETKHDFDGIVLEAVRQLNGEGLSKLEAEAQRETLIRGYRWILVDEYQDIGPEEYALISAVAGRSLDDTELRLSLFAVGDDDQNIYAFAGASIRFIRRFEADYNARPEFLIENYRSTRHIIAAANEVIAPAAARMKAGHDIAIDRKRSKTLPGGEMAALDPVARGRVQVLDCRSGDLVQAMAAVDELVRLSRLVPEWSWSRAAIISRDWRRLAPVRAYAETLGIPVEMANESLPSIWRLREMQQFIDALRRDPTRLLAIRDLVDLLNAIPSNRWTDLIAEGIAALAKELANKSMPVPDVVEWFAEWSYDARSDQRGLLLLTAHRSKGLEFDDIVILNGGWDRPSMDEDPDAPRRLFYVAMTRARRSLAIIANGQHPFVKQDKEHVLRRAVPDVADGVAIPTALYQVPDLKTVDLSWAGRLRQNHPALAAISVAKVGDPVRIVSDGALWMIQDGEGKALGRMAKSWSSPEGLSFLRGEVGAIVRWRKSDNQEEFRARLQRDVWEAVLPELVFG